MKFCTGTSRLFGAGVVVWGLLVGLGREQAEAVAVFQASAGAEIVITRYFGRDDTGDVTDLGVTKPADLEVIGGEEVDIDEIFVDGNGTAGNTPQFVDASDPLGSGVAVAAAAEGSAGYPPESFVFSAWGATAEIEFINHSTTLDYLVEFSVDWRYSVNAEADHPGSEHAVGGIGIEVHSYRDVRLVQNVTSDTDFGGGLFEDSGFVVLSPVLIPKEREDDIRLIVSAGGEATAEATPEPVTMGLGLMSMGGLAVYVGRRRCWRSASD